MVLQVIDKVWAEWDVEFWDEEAWIRRWRRGQRRDRGEEFAMMGQ
jgi:hypothetical protein